MDKKSLRTFTSSEKRRQFLEKKLNIKLENIGNTVIADSQVEGRNIENLIGATQIPLGVAGPIKIQNSTLRLRSVQVRSGQESKVQNYYIPLATTEGALVASVSRGCKAVSKSGGVSVYIENTGITRGPVFKVESIKDGLEAKKWILDNFSSIAKQAEKTSRHLKLLKIDCKVVGQNLYARFYYDSQDAMGMNMATIATQEAANLIEEKTKAICLSLAGNFDIDKKPAWLNFISGRGRQVWAEAVLDKKTVMEVLKTTPETIAEIVYRKCLLGSAVSGSLGFNSHFANIVAAIFLATGQDPAHVVEGSMGITTAEVLQSGDLYFSVYLPSLVVGTVGGGTSLPTQKEAMSIMSLGSQDVLEYCQVVSGAVLAGELSLLSSLAEGSLAKAHQRLGRRKW